jgi:hypothetical protein
MSYNPPPQPPQNQPPGQPQYPPPGQPSGQPQYQPPAQPSGQPQYQPPAQAQYPPPNQPANMPPPPPGYGAPGYGGPGYGAPGYGGKPPVPAQVNTAAILLFISGGFAILAGLLLFAISSLGAVFAVFAVVYLILGGVAIWVGVALRQLKQWARMAAIVLAAISAVFAVISLAKGGYTSIVGLVLDIVIIYMLTQKPVVEVFNRAAVR